MKRILASLIVTVVALLAILVACILHFKSPDQLMTPPNQYGENAEIAQVFEQDVGNSSTVTLKYPSSGDYKTAYVKHDLDGDGLEEVITFYTLKDADTTVRFHIMKYQDEEWTSACDEAGYGSEVDSVSFADFNNDGNDELVLSWNLYGNSSTKVLTVHDLSASGDALKLKTLVNQSYSYMNILDMDRDGTQEVLVVWTDSSVSPSRTYADLLKMSSKGSMKTVGSNVLLDGNVSGYAGMLVQETGDNTIVFLDAYKGDTAMVTEIIWWDADGERLVAPFTDRATLTNQTTLRSPAIRCTDLDGDGIIDIPTSDQNSIANAISGSNDNRVYLTTWSNYTSVNSRSLTANMYGFVDEQNSFMFRVPAGTNYSRIAYRNAKTGVMTVYSSNNGTTTISPLFSLVPGTVNNLPEEDQYSFLVNGEKLSVYGTLTSAAKDAGYTDESVEKNIIIFD